jgi:hypothetical protein
VRKGLFSCTRAEIDDFSRTFADHFRKDYLATEKERIEIDIEGLFPLGQGHLPDIFGRSSNTNHIGQDIDGSKMLQGFLDHLLHRLLFGNIGLEAKHLSPPLL